MIDIHCHLLPNIDDGASDWDEALAMARLAVEQGVEQCVVTPHWTGAVGEVETVQQRLAEFKTRLGEAGVPLRPHAGQETLLLPGLRDSLAAGRALTLAGSTYVLLETANIASGAYLHSALFELQSRGYRIILAHPERVATWHRDAGDLWELARRNCLLQVNAGSLLGEWGHAVRSQAEELVKLGWVSLLASDAHSITHRRCRLGEAAERVERLAGAEVREIVTCTNPDRILLDQDIPAPEFLPPTRRLWWRFW